MLITRPFAFLSFFSLLFVFPIIGLTQVIFPKFEGGEHIFIGDQVKLYLSDNSPGKPGLKLQLPNGLSLTYGEIISLGDLYAALDKPISKGTTDAERRTRFMEGFNAFAKEATALIEAPKLLSVLQREQSLIMQAIEQGKDPEPLYKQLSFETNRQLNCLTGGGCNATWYLYPGRYLKLALIDYDHFGENAWTSYQIGHQLALEEAVKAHTTQEAKGLQLAYAINAYANHFLTDRFASGHIRTPRVELAEQTTPGAVGSILSGYMHAEENSLGLHVHNMRGDRWKAYGDRTYFCYKSLDNRRILTEAIQKSADLIYEAFKTGTFPKIDKVYTFIPYPDERNNRNDKDLAPLFYVDPTSDAVLRRVILEDVNDRHWTNQWWGWSTLLALSNARGLPLVDQAKLATSSEGVYAYRLGLIKHPLVVKYIKKRMGY